MPRRLLLVAGALLLGFAAIAALWLEGRPLAYRARANPTVRPGPRTENARPPPAPVEHHALRSDDERQDEAEALADEADARDDLAPLPPQAPPVVRAEPGHLRSFTETENYLLVGVDHTRGHTWGRADTILVAVFDDDTGHLGIVSVPRDLYVDVPGHGPARINAALRIATHTGQDPLEVMRRVVSDTLAMPIHHVVLGDLDTFERVVDMLGGVTIDVPCPIDDNFIDPRKPSGRRVLSVPAGPAHMDGPTAAMYVRSRHGRSDWDRARRQQAVLFALRAKVRDLGPARTIPLLYSALSDGVTTTMSRLEMLLLARRVARLDPAHIHGVVLGYRDSHAFLTSEGREVLLPDFDAIDAKLGTLFAAPTPGTRPPHATCAPADAALR